MTTTTSVVTGNGFVLERMSDPEIEPVTVEQFKRHVRAYADITLEDEDMAGMISAARENIEDYTGRICIDQTWRLSVMNYTGGGIYLRRSPIIALTSFVSVDATDAESSLLIAGTYSLREPRSKYPRVVPLSGASWPSVTLGSGDTVNTVPAPSDAASEPLFRIEFRAGFADRDGSPQQDGEAVPWIIRQAIKLLAAHYHDNRVPVALGTIATEIPLGIRHMLRGHQCNLNMQ